MSSNKNATATAPPWTSLKEIDEAKAEAEAEIFKCDDETGEVEVDDIT
jgi:hypothetical protein